MKTITASKYENWAVPVELTLTITDEQWNKAVKESGFTTDDDVSLYIIEKFEKDDIDVKESEYNSYPGDAVPGYVELDDTAWGIDELIEAA